MDGIQPLVSVIIPTYNYANYIEEAIESVLEQTYQNYEIIVIDDGSTDNTKEKIAKYQDKIRYVYQENRGLSAARNHGIRIAKGSIIAFLDSDDKFLPEKLEMQTRVFIENPTTDIVNSGLRMIDESGRLLSDLNWWEYFPELNAKILFVYKLIYLGAMMIKKDPLIKISGFNENIKMAEDIDIVFRLLLLGCSATWLKQITVCYRQHKNSMSNSNFLNTAEKAQQVLAIFFSRKDLPEYVRELEKESIYDHLVWCACQFCMRNQEKLMCQFLEKSLRYCTISKWRLEEVWLSKFEVMARSYCLEFNKNKIPANKYWQKLMKKIIKYRAY